MLSNEHGHTSFPVRETSGFVHFEATLLKWVSSDRARSLGAPGAPEEVLKAPAKGSTICAGGNLTPDESICWISTASKWDTP